MANIRPAQATLNELQGGRIMEQLAMHLHDTADAVRALNKAGRVVLTIDIAPWDEKQPLIEAPLKFTAEVSSKQPKPTPPTDLFYLDDEGRPSKNAPRRQADLGLGLAGAAINTNAG